MNAPGETARDLPVVILSTVGGREDAERLARALVDERHAACVSALPGVHSVYRWGDGVEAADEVLLIIKTHAAAVVRLTQRLRELHPYEVPEILVLPVAAGHAPYLDWIRRETTGGEDTP